MVAVTEPLMQMKMNQIQNVTKETIFVCVFNITRISLISAVFDFAISRANACRI